MNTLIPVRGGPAAGHPLAVDAGPAWRDGAVVKAVVGQRDAAGMVELSIGRATIRARGGERFVAGQTLTLKVSVSRQLVLLSTLETPDVTALGRSIVSALPAQTGQSSLLANLHALAGGSAGTRVPPAAVSVARTLLATLPDSATIRSGDGLRRAIADSGLFLEPRLAHAARATLPGLLSSDWKAALLRAAALVTQTGTTTGSPPGSQAPGPAAASQSTSTTASPGQAPANPPGGAPGRLPAGPATTGSPAAPAGQASRGSASPPVAMATAAHSAGDPHAVRQTAAAPATATPARTTPNRPPAHAAVASPTTPDRLAGSTTRQVSRPDGPAGASVAPPLRESGPVPQPVAPATLAGGGGERALPELGAQLTGALARLALAQLASVPREATEPAAWVVELPVRNDDDSTDVIAFRFERGARDRNEPEPVWTASLAFDFPATGPVHATVTLRGDRVSTVFYAERAATAERFRNRLAALERRFDGAGLAVGSVACRCGQPPVPDASPGRLLETHA